MARTLGEVVRGHEALVGAVAGTLDGAALADRLARWCRDHLGVEPAAVPWAHASSGLVVAVDLADGRRLVVKARPAEQRGRIAQSRAVQALLAGDGLPVPRPVGPLAPFGPDGVAGAEERLDGGRAVDGCTPAGRAVLAATLHRLTTRLTALAPASLELHEPWGIALPSDGLWPDPPHDPGFDLVGTGAGAEGIDALASGFRARLVAGAEGVARVVGHVDWRAEHVHVDAAGAVVATFDWDSLVRAPEAVVVGQAAAGFTVDWTAARPRHPTVAEAVAFVAEVERARGAPFDRAERDLLDAAHGYVVAYGARCEHSDERTGRAGHPAADGWRRLLRARGERALA